MSQHPGEPHRRFFYDELLQLYVWQDRLGKVVGFELSYDLWADARAFRWAANAGIDHYRIDDGEGRAMKKGVPILRADRSHVDLRVAAEFANRSAGIDAAIARVVQAELDRFFQSSRSG